ncbi:Multidrug resistance protein 1 [Stylophora pistillata]|uniref:Multidrug resistance protein 1 n=1 Tax=Stylophora pistillata TaxID=50429 RepID=A0A2B4S019_STYPI|nr:Multidrug resistance protein 1 [Stylophora pistillata]
MDVESGNKPDDIQDGGNDLNGSEVKISLGERNGTPPPKEKETTSAADDTALENDGKSGDEKKDKDAKKEEKPPTVPLGQLFRFSDKLDVLLMILGTLSAMGLGATFPLQFIVFGDLINTFIDYTKYQSPNVTQPFDLDKEMTKFALYYVFISVGTLIVAYGHMGLWSLTATRQVKKMRLAFFKSVLKQDIGWFDTTDPGELNTRLNEDLNKVDDGIGHKIGMFVQAMTTVVIGFVMGFAYGWKLTLVIIAVSPLLVIAGALIGKVMTAMTTKGLNSYAKAGSVAEEVLSSIRTVVAFGGEKKEIERYSSLLKEARDFGIKRGFMTGLGIGFFQLVIYGSYALAFWYGSTLIIDDKMTGGQMLVVFFSVMFGAMQLGQAGPHMEAITAARGAAYKVFHIIDRVPPIDSSSADGLQIDQSSLKGRIELKSIEFWYPSRPDVKILNSLNLVVERGQTVALVGESGCGKSTVVKLLQRFYDASNGEVSIDGHDVRSLNLKWLRERIGVVSQEPVLFGTTIAENIGYGKDGVTQDDIERATKMANAHDFIKGLPQGYDTLVGERGTQLSGGQKQRIAIARALVKDPRILLLDEATSALDSESESIVQAALDKARQGRTTIVIAHRLSTVQNADVIAAIQDGVVVEKGSHDDLMKTDGVYRQLVTSQTFKNGEKGDNSGEDDESDNEEIENNEVKVLTPTVKFTRSTSHMSNDSRHEEKRSSALDISASIKAEGKDGEEKILEEEVEPAPVSRIMKLNAKEWPYLLSGSVAAIINGLFPFAFAMLLSEILFSAMFSKSGELMTLRLRKMAFEAILKQVDIEKRNGVERLQELVSISTYLAILQQEISYFDDPLHSTGALTTALGTNASAVQGAAGSRLAIVVQSLSTAVACTVYAFYNGWKLTLVVLSFIPFLIIANAIQMKVLYASGKGSKDGEDEKLQSGKIAVETIQNIRTVASLGRECTFYSDYSKALMIPYKKALRRAHLQGISFGLGEAFKFCATGAAFKYGGYLVSNGEMAMDEVLKVIMSIVIGGATLGHLSALSPDYEKAKMAAARLFKIFDRKSLIDSSSQEGLTPSSLSGTIQLRSVRFRYPTRPDVKVLRGLTLSVQKGQKLALVGSSGCGKSTVVSLLERFYDAQEGEVAIDGNNVRTLNIQWLRFHIGIVSQEPILFGCSIADNIAYGDTSRQVSQDEIEAAAKSANIHSFINSLPNGYTTLVGDKGTLISGGQKQRIAIARAMIRNPQILLLDEATSALDTESEKVVQQALDAACEGRTVIIIAHRLSTVQNADIIAVIHHGRVVEQGTHQELLNLKGVYYGLVTAQMQNTKN